ncbi:hypothetical protein GOP47_0025883 [Adiantum capillus-veneris]|uniref:Uncharacterized protein n=1 Tax=Adiantum capillus-veneris TaxID=13818 RepID=A0A9D4U336_ADICA|nr:hypothetical protein GOP47_0025883 [Adiantum capillus-veneris]
MQLAPAKVRSQSKLHNPVRELPPPPTKKKPAATKVFANSARSATITKLIHGVRFALDMSVGSPNGKNMSCLTHPKTPQRARQPRDPSSEPHCTRASPSPP